MGEGPTNLRDVLRPLAMAFAAENAIAHPGDLVETKWANWKAPRTVRIVDVGVHIIADWTQATGFILRFDMTYTAHRLRKDGSSAEGVPESGICLDRLKTADGREWLDRCVASRNGRPFNHVAMSWEFAGRYAAQALTAPPSPPPDPHHSSGRGKPCSQPSLPGERKK